MFSWNKLTWKILFLVTLIQSEELIAYLVTNHKKEMDEFLFTMNTYSHSLIRDLNSGPLVYETSALTPELMWRHAKIFLACFFQRSTLRIASLFHPFLTHWTAHGTPSGRLSSTFFKVSEGNKASSEIYQRFELWTPGLLDQSSNHWANEATPKLAVELYYFPILHWCDVSKW